MSSVTIQKRGKVYQYKFEIASVDGKRKFINKSGFKTKSEAIEFGNKAYTEYLNAGIPFKESTISYSDYLEFWLNDYCKINLRYNTIQAYKTIINKYIKPKLGHYRLSSITSITLNSFLTNICEEYSFSKAYFKNILKVMKGSFRDACNLYGLIRYNPALTIKLPRIENEIEDIKHLYTQEEIDLIINRFKNDDAFTCSFLTSCYTGMRTGEVFALTWDDIDFDNRIINISHNIYDKPKDNKGRWYIGNTKTINGNRKVYMCDTLYTALKNYKSKQDYLKKIYGKNYIYYHLEYVKNEYGKNVEQRIVENKNRKNDTSINFIFVKENGKYVGTDITKYPFKVIHNELGIRKCRFYDLRGSYATKILNHGIEIRDVADILGHKNIETTENFYISSTDISRKIAVDTFDKIIHSNIIDKVIQYKN